MTGMPNREILRSLSRCSMAIPPMSFQRVSKKTKQKYRDRLDAGATNLRLSRISMQPPRLRGECRDDLPQSACRRPHRDARRNRGHTLPLQPAPKGRSNRTTGLCDSQLYKRSQWIRRCDCRLCDRTERKTCSFRKASRLATIHGTKRCSGTSTTSKARF